jgi:hypothetical protein
MTQEPDGYSQFGFAEAVHEALRTPKFVDRAKEGTKWEVTGQWVEIPEHHSPWHITYNVTIQQVPGSG